MTPPDVGSAPTLQEQMRKRYDTVIARIKVLVSEGLTSDECGELHDLQEERRILIARHDEPTLRAFYEKYAMGPMMAPSCLVCGHEFVGEPAISHAELPGIVVCFPCRDARQENARLRELTLTGEKMIRARATGAALHSALIDYRNGSLKLADVESCLDDALRVIVAISGQPSLGGSAPNVGQGERPNG